MTAAVANTTMTVLRGTGKNQFGDTIDAGTPVLSGIPVFIGEVTRTVQDPTTPTPRVIRSATAQVPGWCGLQNTDQVVDERTGAKYIVLSVTQPPALFGSPADWDQVAELKRVTAGGV